MYSPLVGFAAAGLMLLTADAGDNASRKDLEKLQGGWKIQGMQVGGKDVDLADLDGAVLTIDGGSYTLAKDGKTLDEGTITLDATKKPPTLDIQPKRDGAKLLMVVYQLDGDAFKEAFTKDGSSRPTAVASKEGSDVIVISFKREKK
jgi:uncharacterized protein (TIGR03067 family)